MLIFVRGDRCGRDVVFYSVIIVIMCGVWLVSGLKCDDRSYGHGCEQR